MKRGALIAFVFGLALFIALLVYTGAGAILQALEVAGWGLVGIAAFHALPLALDSAGQWYALPHAGEERPRLATTLRARWIAESVNGLLPVAQMGGLFVMARVIAQRGYPGSAAGAGVTVGTTLQMLAQMLFSFVGVLLLISYSGDIGIVLALVLGISLFTAFCVWFYHLQRHGLYQRLAGFLQRLSSGRDWESFSGGAQALDAAVRRVYAQLARVWASFFLYLAGWVVGTGEVWLALHALDIDVSLQDAFLLESLGQAITAMAFIIPGALGVQEGGYVLLCALIGVPADAAIALSLIKRVRQLALGIPGLLSWQLFEGRRLRARTVLPATADPVAKPISDRTPRS